MENTDVHRHPFPRETCAIGVKQTTIVLLLGLQILKEKRVHVGPLEDKRR